MGGFVASIVSRSPPDRRLILHAAWTVVTEKRGISACMEAAVNTESWTEERERLARLLKGIESGSITHIDQDGLDQLQPTGQKNISMLRSRLAELNNRLGEK